MTRQSYDTDISSAQWSKISRLLPLPSKRGRPRTQDFQEIVNAIFYILRPGCAWRLLPHDATPMADSVLL